MMIDRSENLEKKKAIASKFKEYFFNFGMVDTIISDVTQDMHISKKTFYKYFPGGKQDCLYFIFYDIAKESKNEIDQILSDKTNFAKIKSAEILSILFQKIYEMVLPYVYGNKAQTKEDYLIENQIVGNAYADVFSDTIKKFLSQGKEADQFHFSNLDLTYEAITAIVKKSIALIYDVQQEKSQVTTIQQETIELILKILN
ncbi:TetR/AcrR family transcriptional regulator [Candidatus Harpocratesius sp.]